MHDHGGEQQINIRKIEKDRHTELRGSTLGLHPQGLREGRIHYIKLDLQSLQVSHPHCTIDFIDFSFRSRHYCKIPCLEVEKAFPRSLARSPPEESI